MDSAQRSEARRKLRVASGREPHASESSGLPGEIKVEREVRVNVNHGSIEANAGAHPVFVTGGHVYSNYENRDGPAAGTGHVSFEIHEQTYQRNAAGQWEELGSLKVERCNYTVEISGRSRNIPHAWDVQYREKVSAEQVDQIRAGWEEHRPRPYSLATANCAGVTNDCVVKRGGLNLESFRTPKGAAESISRAKTGISVERAHDDDQGVAYDNATAQVIEPKKHSL